MEGIKDGSNGEGASVAVKEEATNGGCVNVKVEAASNGGCVDVKEEVANGGCFGLKEATGGSQKYTDRKSVEGEQKGTAGSLGGEGAECRPIRRRPPYFRKEKGPEDPTLPKEIPKELIPENAVDITHDKSGKLWKILIDPGVDSSGKSLIPRSGALAKIHYRCWMLTDVNKNVFDSSSLIEGDDEPVELNLGAKQVIRGIDEGVRTMTRKGEKALFIMHYDYAYGLNSSRLFEAANIPDGSFVCAEIELVDMDGVGTDQENATWNMKTLKLGDREEDPGAGVFYTPLTTNSLMFIKLEGWKEGEGETDQEKKRIFFPEIVLPFTPCFHSWGYYPSGSTTTYPIPKILEPLLKSLRKGDKMLFTFKEESAFDEGFARNGVNVDAGEEVKFLVEVDEVEEILDPFMLSLQEKVDYCQKLILRGMLYLTQSFYDAAACKFSRVREYLTEAKLCLKTVPTELGLRCDEQLYFALCKLGEMFRKLPDMEAKEALGYFTEAVKLAEGGEKGQDYQMCSITDAYNLRGKLYSKLKEFDLAKKDYAKAVELTKIKISGSSELEDELAQKLNNLKIMFEGQVDNADMMEKLQRKSYPFKYVPPK